MNDWQPISSAPNEAIMVSDGTWFGGPATQILGEKGLTGQWCLWYSFLIVTMVTIATVNLM